MLRLLKKHFAFLKSLVRQKDPKKASEFLGTCSEAQIKFLVELCHNILIGNIRLNEKQRKNLVGFASPVRTFARKRTTGSARRAFQKGGGFPLAAVAVPVLAELVRLVARK